jgi:integrase
VPKRIQPLTELKAKNAKPKATEYKLSDGLGLHLLVTPSGGKLWRLQYRYDGKQKKISFGAYPSVSLAEARKRRDEARDLVSEGIDPGAEKKAQRRSAVIDAENTFEKVTRRWYKEKKEEWTDHHAHHVMRRLEMHVFPVIGERPISSIETPELVGIMRKVSKHSVETGHRIKTIFYQVFRWATYGGVISMNPAADLRGAIRPKNPKPMAAPTDPKDVGPMLRALDQYQGSFVVQCALKLAPLWFCRPGELRSAEWSEVDFAARTYSIPPERMKMGLGHIIPLSEQAVAILEKLKEVTGRGRFVFPSGRTTLRCMSENAITAALRRMGFDGEELTGHGFRAMARTILDEVLDVRADFIEHQLAHAVKDPNGRAYNRTTHLESRREMMQLWADYLDELKATPSGPSLSRP